MAQAAARERHAELLKQGPPVPPTLPMPIMGGPRPPWGGPNMPPPNAFPPRGFPGQGFPQVPVHKSHRRESSTHQLIYAQAAGLPAELSRPKYALAAGRADVSSAARRVPRCSVRATGGADASAGAEPEAVAVARAVSAAATAWGLRVII